FKNYPRPHHESHHLDTTHVNFIKQWTLSAGVNTNSINSIDLSLAGNVYTWKVSAGVLGYVNVSGDSRAIVDGVSVSSDADNNIDEKDNSGGEISVRLENRLASGHVLTEIFLANLDAVAEVTSQRSGQVVIEDNVLVRWNGRAELQINATDSSVVYVSAPNNAHSISRMRARDSSRIKVLSIWLHASQLKLDAVDVGSICMSAQKAKASVAYVNGGDKISLPLSSKKHGTTGTFACEKSMLPERKAAKIADPS
ncbi:hypothetical protein PHMEG_00034775, partial [Phytophthora megakarya]